MPVLLLLFRQVKPALWKAPLAVLFCFVDKVREPPHATHLVRTPSCASAVCSHVARARIVVRITPRGILRNSSCSADE